MKPLTAELRKEIRKQWDSMQVRPEKSSDVRWCVGRILKNKSRYEKLEAATGVRWWFIAVLHGMECGFSFEKWLANGDPLTDETKNVPRGLRVPGEVPPYSFDGAAIHIIKAKKLPEVQDWSLENVLWMAEQFNGLGYRRKGLPSQYVWSFTSVEKPGRYVADGVWDAKTWSGQCGVAAMLVTLALAGEINFDVVRPQRTMEAVGWFEARLILDNPDQWEVGVIAKIGGSDDSFATLRVPVQMHMVKEFQEQFKGARTTVVADKEKPWPKG